MVLLAEARRPRLVREHRLAPWFAVATVCFGAFMGQLDASIVTLAFPAIQGQFWVGLAGVQWVSLGYLLVLVALLVPVGRWSDRVGRKTVYLYGFALFTVASVVCGVAWSLPVLVGMRLVQAVGAAMLQANSVALVSTSVPGQRRRAALGVQAGAQALGLAVGPTLGGVLVAAVGWRWIFWVNVPVGVVAVVAGWFLLPRTRNRVGGGQDVPGAMLLAVATSAALLVLSSWGGLRLPVVWTVVLAAAALAAVSGLVWWERRAPEALVDPAVLSTPGVGAALTGALLAYLVLFGPLVLFPQLDAGLGPATAGLVLTALPAGFGLSAVAAERVLPASWSDRRRCVAGGLLAAAAAAALAASVPVPVRVVLLAVMGLGLGMFIPANNTVVMAAMPARLAATAGGMVNMTRGLGTAVGVALVTIVVHLTRAPTRTHLTVPVTMALLAGAALGAAVTARSARSPRRFPTQPPAPRPDTGRHG